MRIAVSRAPDAERVVSPLELFFDLVYVFAIGQLAHHLVAHVDLRTGAETAILALAVVNAWTTTAWGTNWLEPDRLLVRVLLVGLMFASLLMSVAIPDAFDGRAWLFALFLIAQVIFRRETVGHIPRSRPLGLAGLAILALATAPLTMIVGIAAASAVLVAVAIADTVREGTEAPTRLAD